MNGFHHIPMAAAAKLEATAYTAETLSAADHGIPFFTAKITQAIERSSDNIRSPKGGRMGGIVTKRNCTWSIEAPLYGKGLNTGDIVLPRYVSEIIQTAFALDTSSEVSECAAVPSPHFPSIGGVAAKDTFTLGLWMGQRGSTAAGKKVFRQAYGCRLGSLTFAGTVGGNVKVMMEGPGLYIEDTEVTTDLTGYDPDGFVRADQITPNLAGFTVDGQAVAINAFELKFDFGAGHEDANDNANGSSGTFLTDTTVTLTLDPRLMEQSTYDLISKVHAGEQLAISMAANGMFPATRTGDTGYGFRFQCAAATPMGTEYSETTPIKLPLTFDVEKDAVDGDEAPLKWL